MISMESKKALFFIDNFKTWLEKQVEEAECNKMGALSPGEDDYWDGYLNAVTSVLAELKWRLEHGNK